MLDTPMDLDPMFVSFVPPTDEPEPKVKQAGMTAFENDHDARGPDENVTRAAELDRAISALIRDMSQNMNANPDYLALGADVVGFQRDWAAWRADHLSYFQMTGTENDLNRFTSAYSVLRERFQKLTGQAPSAPPLTNPPPSNPLGLPDLGDLGKVALAVGTVAALVIFGPAIARHI